MISPQNRPSGTSRQPQALRLLIEREMPRLHEGLPELSNFGALRRLDIGVVRRRRWPFDGSLYWVHRHPQAAEVGAKESEAEPYRLQVSTAGALLRGFQTIDAVRCRQFQKAPFSRRSRVNLKSYG